MRDAARRFRGFYNSIKGKILMLFLVAFLVACGLTLLNVWTLAAVRERLNLSERYDDLFNSILEARRFEKNLLIYGGEDNRREGMGAKGGDSDWYGYCVDDPVNRVDVWGLFVFKERPLDSPIGSVPEISTPWLDKHNLELKHVQGWFEDGTGDNIGKFSDGVRSEIMHTEGDYSRRSETLPDDIAREALRRWPPEKDSPYSCTSDNCQDWETQMRQRMHEIGREQRGSALDPR